MQKSYQSLYLLLYRWNFKNFGHGSLPKVKSLFSISFLLVVLLTVLLVFAELIIKKNLLNVDLNLGLFVLMASVFFLMVNHFIFLNNRWFSKVNLVLEKTGKHNKNLWSAVVLVNVVIACFCIVFMIGY